MPRRRSWPSTGPSTWSMMTEPSSPGTQTRIADPAGFDQHSDPAGVDQHSDPALEEKTGPGTDRQETLYLDPTLEKQPDQRNNKI